MQEVDNVKENNLYNAQHKLRADHEHIGIGRGMDERRYRLVVSL